jgi:triacylglycerol lipase
MRRRVARLVWGRLAAIVVSALAAAGCGSGAEDVAQAAGGEPPITGAGGSGGQGSASTSTSGASTGGGGTGGEAPMKLGPPYPVVLAHGFFGFEEFAGVDFATYFYGVKEHLAQEGEVVYTPAVDPFNSSEFRGAQLVEIIEGILAETGHAKVNLIGHSQGGLDARVVAHDRPDLVASVTTFATPHYGSPIADIALEVLADPNLEAVLDWIVDVIGAPLYDEVGDETSLAKPMYLFSQQGIAEFNAKYTDSAGVIYLSVTGRSDYDGGGDDCVPDLDLPFVSPWNDELDPIDPLLSLTESILDGGFGEFIANDGLVRARDARWGQFLGCVPADHLDQVGQIFSGDPGLGNQWEYLNFYAQVIAYLRSKDL